MVRRLVALVGLAAVLGVAASAPLALPAPCSLLSAEHIRLYQAGNATPTVETPEPAAGKPRLNSTACRYYLGPGTVGPVLVDLQVVEHPLAKAQVEKDVARMTKQYQAGIEARVVVVATGRDAACFAMPPTERIGAITICMGATDKLSVAIGAYNPIAKKAEDPQAHLGVMLQVLAGIGN